MTKEQVAHDLTMLYLANRYGVDVIGNFSAREDTVSGDVHTEKFPHVSKIKYKKVGTGEKISLG